MNQLLYSLLPVPVRLFSSVRLFLACLIFEEDQMKIQIRERNSIVILDIIHMDIVFDGDSLLKDVKEQKD
jgi:hypothetical protein